jgi:lactoylglutathione lyase
MPDPDALPAPGEGFVLTHFLIVSDQNRSSEWYAQLFDAQVLRERDPVMLRAANSWLNLNQGGGPTDDMPDVTLTTPQDPSTTSAFLNVRVADIAAIHREWAAKGIGFLTEPRTTARRSEIGQATGMRETLEDET